MVENILTVWQVWNFIVYIRQPWGFLLIFCLKLHTNDTMLNVRCESLHHRKSRLVEWVSSPGNLLPSSPPRRPQATPGSDVTDIVRDTAALVTCCVITGNNMTHCIRHIFAECTISPWMTVRKQIVGKILEFWKSARNCSQQLFNFWLVSWENGDEITNA